MRLLYHNLLLFNILLLILFFLNLLRLDDKVIVGIVVAVTFGFVLLYMLYLRCYIAKEGTTLLCLGEKVEKMVIHTSIPLHDQTYEDTSTENILIENVSRQNSFANNL